MGDSLPRSPLAPRAFPQLPVIKGLRLSAGAAGVKYKGRNDVMLAVMAPGTTVAGTFTRSKTRSAPVRDCQEKLAKSDADYSAGAAILVNSGNSNAFTGHYGQTSVAEISAAVAKITDLPSERVFTASTGVIGEPLPLMRHDALEKRDRQRKGEIGDVESENAVARFHPEIDQEEGSARQTGPEQSRQESVHDVVPFAQV